MSDSYATTPVLAPEDLARLAREAVATGNRAALRISGLAAPGAGRDSLRLFDSGGIPQLVCRVGSPIAAAVGRRAWLTVHADLPGRLVAGRSEVNVLLSGRICHPRHQPTGPDDLVTLALRLGDIRLELSGGPGPTVSADVRIGVYLGVRIDPLIDYAVSLAQHLGEHHAVELRAGAARLAGVGADDVLAATITDVTRQSARLHWIDADGAHLRLLEFREAATDPESLDYLLREQLAGF